MISDSHDIFCGCTSPFAHLLDSIFPEGHKDRGKTVQHIIARDKQQCLSGGTEEENSGMAVGESAATLLKQEREEEGGPEDDLDALLVAAASAAEGTR